MKLHKWLIIILLCQISLVLSQCSHKPLREHGKMEFVMYQGFRCWYFKSDTGKYYEVVTPSTQILREGLSMYAKLVRVEKQTFCGLGDTVEIVEYKADDTHNIPTPPTDLNIH